jgi:formin 1
MALASFKINDRNDQIFQALTALDERVVNAELLVCLQRFFPTEEEAALLRAYTGSAKSLGPAERFFFLLLQVPDIAQRIDCFLYKLRFGRSYRSVYSKIQVVKRACRDLVENYSFVQALTEVRVFEC